MTSFLFSDFKLVGRMFVIVCPSGARAHEMIEILVKSIYIFYLKQTTSSSAQHYPELISADWPSGHPLGV